MAWHNKPGQHHAHKASHKGKKKPAHTVELHVVGFKRTHVAGKLRAGTVRTRPTVDKPRAGALRTRKHP